jgi:multiple sugar transport system permease protein
VTTHAAEAPVAAPRPAGRGGTLARRQARLAYAFVSPSLVVVVVLVLFPVVWNIALSLQQLRLVELRTFDFFSVDFTLRNYDRVVGDDFLPLLARTLVYAIGGTSLAIVLGTWAALVVRRAFPGRSLVRGLVLFPYVVPVVAAALLWRTMLNPQFGIVNAWLRRAGLGSVNFLLQQNLDVTLLGITVSLPLALTMVILFEAWRSFPFAFLFVLARLQAMPADLEEAARVDGATVSQRFRYIILPQLRSVFAVLFLLRFIWTFNAFDEIYLLTAGAAGTQVISVQIYEWLFGRSDVGAAAALSIVLAFTLAILLAVYFRFFYREEVA